MIFNENWSDRLKKDSKNDSIDCDEKTNFVNIDL